MAPKPAAKIAVNDIAPPAEAAFAITVSQPTRLPRTLKYGDTFIALDGRGDIGTPTGESAGLFHEDTRHLSRLALLVNGPPLLLGANLRDDNSAFIVDLTNPDIKAGDRLVLEKDRLHILRTMFLWRAT